MRTTKSSLRDALHLHILTWIVCVMVGCLCSCFTPGTAFAEPQDGKDRYTLYFYDEKEETELIRKTVLAGRSTTIPLIKKEYLPNRYKDNDNITSCWILKGDGGIYYPGDDYYTDEDMEYDIPRELIFILVPDEKSLDYDASDVFFYTSDYQEIDEYNMMDVRVGSKITLPNPAPYGGTFWSYETERGERKLLKRGSSFTVPSESVEFYVCGNESVAITYLYPVDVDYLATDNEPGDIYWTENAKVGDYITLKSSPGNVVFGKTFRGWKDYSGQYDGILPAGHVIQIAFGEDLELVAYYEEDENWDPNKENSEIQMKPDGLKTQFTRELAEISGAGVDIVLNNNAADGSFGGEIAKTGGSYTAFSQNDTKKTAKNGAITTTTRVDLLLSSDKEDQYGRSMDKNGDRTKPLIQDDSLFAMDIYGNAFAYPYWASSEAERIQIVTERLRQYKGNSWMNFISRHSELADAVKRFEDREFDLLKDSCSDRLKIDRVQWRGWMDYYSDLPSSIGNEEINNLDGETNRLLSRIKYSNAWDGYTFYQTFYDPTQSKLSTYVFNGISSLSATQTKNLTIIFNTLIRSGYSEAAACGAAALIWENTKGSFSATYSSEGRTGLGAWDDEDVERFSDIAKKNGQSWNSIDIQAECFVVWMDEHMDEINDILAANTGIIIKDYKKLNSEINAADILCAAFLNPEDNRTNSAMQIFDGKYYKSAADMRSHASMIRKALEKSENGYGFDISGLNLSDCSEIRKQVVELACKQVGKQYVWGSEGPTTFDCSGLTLWVYKTVAGIYLPHHSTSQFSYGRQVSQPMLRPGDLAVWEGHVGMYIGNGKMVEAAGTKQGVIISSVTRKSSKRFLGYVSLLD